MFCDINVEFLVGNPLALQELDNDFQIVEDHWDLATLAMKHLAYHVPHLRSLLWTTIGPDRDLMQHTVPLKGEPVNGLTNSRSVRAGGRTSPPLKSRGLSVALRSSCALSGMLHLSSAYAQRTQPVSENGRLGNIVNDCAY